MRSFLILEKTIQNQTYKQLWNRNSPRNRFDNFIL